MDSAFATAHVRGFETEYFWRIFIEGGSRKPLAEGRTMKDEGGNGSVQIDLMKNADNKFEFPENRILRMELGTRRSHPRTFKILESKKTGIRFIVQPWFHYVGPNPPGIRVTLPFNSPINFH